MKKHTSHIIFFVLASLLVISAGVLGINGLSDDFSDIEEVSSNRLMLDETPEASILDTTKYLEDPCYEFCQLESVQDGDSQVDVLSKTVVKVENDNGLFEDIDKLSIKKFPANRSLNLMIEKYTLKRKMVNSTASFFVTMESFNTRIERNDFFGISLETTPDYETSLCPEQIEQIKKYCADEEAFKLGTTVSRPL